MKISILGTRGEISESLPYHSKHSGILIDDDLLIDLGEKSFLKYHPKWILITHFHPDHAYFMRHGKEEIPSTNASIFAPEAPPLVQPIVTLIDKRMEVGPYSITPIPTHHSKHVKSQGYVIKKGDHSFLYTGDLVWINKKYHASIGQVDLVITEASFIRKGGMIKKDHETGQIFGHNGVPNLISLLKPFSKNILFVHFGSWFYEDTKKARKTLFKLGKEHNLHVIVGYDGLIVKLDAFS